MILKTLRQSILTYVRRGIQYSSGLFPKLNIPLKTSLVPSIGDATPTFSRTTTGTVLDFEGVTWTAKINELRFPGLRRVENLLSETEELSTQTVTVEAGSDYVLSFLGSGSVTLSGAAIGVVYGMGADRFFTTITAASTSLTVTVSGSVLQAQLIKSTGSLINKKRIGFRSVGANTYSASPKTIITLINTDGSMIVPPAMYGNGTVAIHIYLSADWTRPLKVGLYSGDTFPETLVAKSSEITSGFVSGWNTFYLQNATIEPGLRYFPAFSYSSGTGNVYYSTGYTAAQTQTSTYDGLVDTWVTETSYTTVFSCYYSFSPATSTYKDFEVPGGYTNVGLAYDPVLDCLWSGDYTNGEVHAVNKYTGEEISSFSIPDGDTNLQGVAYDASDDTLWVCLDTNGLICNYSKSGELIRTINTFSGVMLTAALSCIPDTNYLLVGVNLSPVLHKIDKTTGVEVGTITVSGITDSGGTDGLAYDESDDTLWVTQNGNTSIVHCDLSGATIDLWYNPSPGIQGEGICWDSTAGILWYSDDAEYHSGITDGNRIWPLEYKGKAQYTPTDDYVSNGETSWPYHGCGIDGVKYFNSDRLSNSLVSKGSLFESSGAGLTVHDVLAYQHNTLFTKGCGSISMEFEWNGSIESYSNIFYLSDGTANNRIGASINTSGYLTLVMVRAGVSQVSIATTSHINTGVHYKLLITFDTNNYTCYLNGVIVHTSTSCTPPTSITKLNIGSSYLNTQNLNGYIYNVLFYDKDIKS